VRRAAQALLQLVELAAQTLGPKINRVGSRSDEGPAIRDGVAVEVGDAMALPAALHGQFLPVGLRPADRSKHRDRSTVCSLEPGEDTGFAQCRIAGLERLRMNQPNRPQHTLGEEQEVRDHLANIAALHPESQPVRLLLPCAGPGGVGDDDVGAHELSHVA